MLQSRNIHYFFEEHGAFYNSLSVAKSLLYSNGINCQNIYLQEVGPDCKIHFKAKFDLVVSLLSWGHHYPVSTYLDQVYDSLNSGGVVILDIRKESRGEEELKAKFRDIKVICETSRSLRVAAQKQI